MAPQAVTASREQWARLRPEAQLRSLTATYNCVGMVFASRRTWVDNEHVQMILDDDAYRPVELESAVVPGDVVTYIGQDGSFAHIGIVLEKIPDVGSARFRFKILSKWGAGGEYIHEADDVPATLGRRGHFFTERR